MPEHSLQSEQVGGLEGAGVVFQKPLKSGLRS